MPILDSKQGLPPKAKPVEPITVAPEVRNQVVDSRYVPSTALLTHVEGASWTVDFYSQVLDQDNETSDLQLSQKAVYQQYKLVRHLELKVTTPLSYQQQDADRNSMIAGSATVYGGLIPNQGDIFLADCGDGRVGVFTITRTEKKAVFKDAVYAVDYVMRDYLTKQYKDDLARKVVKDTTFVRDFIYYGQNPVMATSEFEQVSQLGTGYKKLLTQYLVDFFNTEYQTLILPDQVDVTYDPFFVTSFLSTLDNTDHPLIMKVRALNTDCSVRFKENNLWTCLIGQDGEMLDLCWQKGGLTSYQTFDESPLFDGIYYSGVQQVVFPAEASTLKHVDGQYQYADPLVPGRLLVGQQRFKDLSRVFVQTELKGFHIAPEDATGVAALPDIHLVNREDFYVLSRAFYENDPAGFSKLEKLLWDMLTGEAIDKTVLLYLVRTSKNWNNLERFYYVPMLMMLIKVGLRDF